VDWTQVVKFSHGGHLFAAVNKNVIQVYSTYALHGHAQVLKGHAGPVTSLCWSSNDQRLASCSAAGELFEWRMDTMTRDHGRNSVLRSCRWAPFALPEEERSVAFVVADFSLTADKPTGCSLLCQNNDSSSA
jgi:WD40 repeat protein